jgi:hypothetical protein
MVTEAKKSAPRKPVDQLSCPECGKTFTRAQALGAHRRQAHGVAGTSKNAKNQRAVVASTATSRRGGKLRARATNSSASAAPQSKRARGAVAGARGSGNGRRQKVERDALLRTLFPTGIPPQQEVIVAVNSWLDEAERLARIR